MGSPNPSSPLPLNIFFCSMWNFFPLQTFPHFKPDLPVTAKFSLLLLKAWSVSLKFNSFLFMFSIPEINCFCYLFSFLEWMWKVEGGTYSAWWNHDTYFINIQHWEAWMEGNLWKLLSRNSTANIYGLKGIYVNTQKKKYRE